MKNALDIFWTLAPLALGGLWIVTAVEDHHLGYMFAGMALVWVSGAMAALSFAERQQR